jgi:hypothetical protein
MWRLEEAGASRFPFGSFMCTNWGCAQYNQPKYWRCMDGDRSVRAVAAPKRLPSELM